MFHRIDSKTQLHKTYVDCRVSVGPRNIYIYFLSSWTASSWFELPPGLSLSRDLLTVSLLLRLLSLPLPPPFLTFLFSLPSCRLSASSPRHDESFPISIFSCLYFKKLLSFPPLFLRSLHRYHLFQPRDPFIFLFPSSFCLTLFVHLLLSCLLFPTLQPCVAALRGTLCCPQPLFAVLRVLPLWHRLFLSSYTTTTTLYYPPLPTSWQVHTLCTSRSCSPPGKLDLSLRPSGTETVCLHSRLHLLFSFLWMFVFSEATVCMRSI